mgnify:CR=1 FL=1
MSAQSLESWCINTDFLIIETEIFDDAFRRTHVCICKDKIDYGNGRWFCGKLIAARNQELKKKWKENLLICPTLNDAMLSSDKFNTLNILTR